MSSKLEILQFYFYLDLLLLTPLFQTPNSKLLTPNS
jgi:hypothetical protein